MRCLLLVGLLLVGCSRDNVTNDLTPEKKEFIRFVQKVVDDPTGLEIITWGERKFGKRMVRFRCKSIRNEIMIDDISLVYEGDKIVSGQLDRGNYTLKP